MGNCFGIPSFFKEYRSRSVKDYKPLLICDAEEENRVNVESDIGDFLHDFESSVVTNINQKDGIRECFEPLREEDSLLVKDGLSDFNKEKVLVKHANSNIYITGKTLQCLGERGWLNDEVVNLYFVLLKEREQREPKKFLKCHFFNTFFFKKLTSCKDGYNYQAVRRWTTERKLGYSLFDCEKIFVPVHEGTHWTLGIISKNERKFQYVDSFRRSDTEVTKILSMYYMDEVKDKTGEDIDVSSWKQENVRNLPVQKNGYDCGVFMIKYTDFYSRGIRPCFSQKDMPYFRQRTTKEILNRRAD